MCSLCCISCALRASRLRQALASDSGLRLKHKAKVLEEGSVALSHGSVSLEHIRKMLQGPEIEPDGLNRDLRLFFAMSWGLVSSPSICPLLPDKLDAQLSQVTPQPPFPSPSLSCNLALRQCRMQRMGACVCCG